jgi:hypothetical protein
VTTTPAAGSTDNASSVQFFVDVIARAVVLGVPPDVDPDHVTSVLGNEFGENRWRNVMWRDYGLVEFAWERADGNQPWRGTGLSVQVHRLATIGPEVANAVLTAHYGRLPLTVSFAEVRARLSALSIALVEVPASSPEYREFWQPDSLVSVLVSASDGNDVPEGCIYAISGPLPAEAVASRRDREIAAPLKQAIRHLLDLEDEQRVQWLQRSRLAERADEANWWLFVMLLIRQQVVDRVDRRADWAALYLWAVRQAGVAFTEAESAQQTARFVTELHRQGFGPELTAVLPSSDSLVEACLRLIPLHRGEIPDTTDLDRLDLPTLRRARWAKNLIEAAAPHLGLVHDQGLAGELVDWIAVLPKLV